MVKTLDQVVTVTNTKEVRFYPCPPRKNMADVFNGSKIRRLLHDEQFLKTVSSFEKGPWNGFAAVCV